MNDQSIDQNYKQVVNSLAEAKASTLSQPKETAKKAEGALQALGERPIESDWPRLNDHNQPINFGPLSFPGKELIARLHQFIQNEPPQDQDNLFMALIGALDDGKDACHTGKAQRVVIAVIQGSTQLPGVDIDQIKNDKPPLEMAKRAVQEFQLKSTAADILAEYPVTDPGTPEFAPLKQRLVEAVAVHLKSVPTVDGKLFNQQFNQLNQFAEGDEHRL